MSRKKLLITGSTGFIFSNFIRRTLHQKNDYKIVSIDKVLNPKGLHNVYINKSHTFYMGDIADFHFINRVFELEKPDIVLNGAAESFVDASIENASPFIHSNVLGTQVLIDASVKHKVEKFVQVSTDEVYGHLTDESAPGWDETAPLNPRNPYSSSKAAGELLLKAAHQTHGLEYNILRSCNNYGPRQLSRNLIPKIIKNILEEKPVPIYGQGKQLREWIYVDDNCSAIQTILNNGTKNEIYNISSGAEFSNIEVFHEICNILERGHSLLQFVDERPGHDFRYSLNSNKLKTLGWKPCVKFKDGLKLCINWYLQNKWYLD